MGVRIGRTASKGQRRGCWLRPSLAVLGAVALGLVLTACPGKTDSPPPNKRQLEVTSYRQCVGTDRSKAAQDRCQVHVWGRIFGEDDERWVCDRMGNWECAPTEVKS